MPFEKCLEGKGVSGYGFPVVQYSLFSRSSQAIDDQTEQPRAGGSDSARTNGAGRSSLTQLGGNTLGWFGTHSLNWHVQYIQLTFPVPPSMQYTKPKV